MSFRPVFRSLQELFPQIDLRVLKAVAIEHSADVDEAVEFILSEVLPSLEAHQVESFSFSGPPLNNSKSPEGDDLVFDTKNDDLSDSSLNKTLLSSQPASLEVEQLTQLENSHLKSTVPSCSISKFSIECNEPVDSISTLSVGHQELNGSVFHPGYTDENTGSTKVLQAEEKDESPSCSADTVDEIMVPEGEDTVDKNHAANEISSRSGHLVSIDYLEELVLDCKGIKSVMASEIESVRDLIKEVDLCEKESQLAKEEASKAGLDTLAKVEELKEMLKHAEEANNMHAGEVYGEKSILATEAKELQSRLLSLSEQRHKTLAIIDEIRNTLRARMDAAEKERLESEQEKNRKESAAGRALEEQETIMNRVVQESKKLHKEAEENSKLREFLMERGRLVDTLQGEISIICEDVLRLKDRVDQGLPLRKSPSSSFNVLGLDSSSCSSVSSASAKPADSVKPAGQPVSDKKLLSSGDQPATAGDDDDDDWEYFNHDSELINASMKQFQ